MNNLISDLLRSPAILAIVITICLLVLAAKAERLYGKYRQTPLHY